MTEMQKYRDRHRKLVLDGHRHNKAVEQEDYWAYVERIAKAFSDLTK